MRDIDHADQLLKKGKLQEAYKILEDILSLAPGNSKALLYKAALLDKQGRFDAATPLYESLYQRNIHESEDTMEQDLMGKWLREEREVAYFCEKSTEGMNFYTLPKIQFFFSLIGFLGSLYFLVESASTLRNAGNNIQELIPLFLGVVLVPWIVLSLVQLFSVQRVVIGMSELKVVRRLWSQKVPWETITHAKVEYSNDIHKNYLKLKIYTAGSSARPVLSLNLAESKCWVRARRRFASSVLKLMPVIYYQCVDASHPTPPSTKEQIQQTSSQKDDDRVA